jgi:UDP-GlcNAc:undecaprenyl-phosphate GlcNAc-1-phosphate transferase
MNILKYINSKKGTQKIENITSQLEKYFKKGLKDRDLHIRILAVLPIILCYTILAYAYTNLPELVPLWYTKPWGEGILSSKINLFIIPLVATLFTATIFILAYFAKKFYFTYLSQIVLTGAVIFNIVSLATILRVVSISSTTPLAIVALPQQIQTLARLTFIGFFASFFLLPKFTSWAVKKQLVTDPGIHQHPGMILTKPSARGGGFVFSAIFTFLALIFLEKTPVVLGTTLSVLICGVIGLLDDFQNTSIRSKLKFLENPIVRLLIFLPIPVICMMAFGIVAGYINNPFNGDFVLASFSLKILGQTLTPLPYLFTLIWTLAIMNMISWSNGVDGQFGGVAGISMLVIGILALRLVETEPAQLNTAKLAFLASGIAFGFIKHTWHPSKIMWGFGAVSIGLLLSSLSITSRAKVATAIMVILIPFLDGFITVLRRLLQKKNPLKGDRGHLHHLLLERGWSPQKVAVFYWIATAVFGVIGLLSADRSTALVTLTLGGLVASGIILLNISSRFKRVEKEKTIKPKQNKETLPQLV